MAASLICLTGVLAGRVFPVGTGLVIGTDPTVCQLTLPMGYRGISRNHCKLTYDRTSRMFVLHDMGSTNGTYLENGTRVPQGMPCALHPGSRFYLVDKHICFEVRA